VLVPIATVLTPLVLVYGTVASNSGVRLKSLCQSKIGSQWLYHGHYKYPIEKLLVDTFDTGLELLILSSDTRFVGRPP